MKALEENPNWQAIKQVDRQRLLTEGRLKTPGELSIGDDAGLIKSLRDRSLPVWATTAEALPERFRQATLAAAKLLEPKTERVRLTSGTLKSPEDVKAWLAATETVVLGKLKKGPIVIN